MAIGANFKEINNSYDTPGSRGLSHSNASIKQVEILTMYQTSVLIMVATVGSNDLNNVIQ